MISNHVDLWKIITWFLLLSFYNRTIVCHRRCCHLLEQNYTFFSLFLLDNFFCFSICYFLIIFILFLLVLSVFNVITNGQSSSSSHKWGFCFAVEKTPRKTCNDFEFYIQTVVYPNETCGLWINPQNQKITL